MTFDTITIPSGSVSIPGELYAPGGAASTGLVVLAYGTDGLEDNERGPWKTMLRGYAEGLAERGFWALIPDYFAKTGTKPGLPAAEVLLQKRDEWVAALVDTVAHARTLRRVDSARIGLLGFSLGGHLCLRARAAARPRALVEYFAPMFDGIGSRGAVTHAQIHHGTKDALPATAFSNAGVIESILNAEGTNTILFAYDGAGHGFVGTDADNKTASALSKTRTVTFFSTHL